MHSSVLARARQRAASPMPGSSGEALQRVIEQLMPRLRLAVIFGGDKSTGGSVLYETRSARSWKSYQPVAEDIAASLKRIGFRHVEVFPEDMQLGERLRDRGIHMAWLNSGGIQGYNSVAHASGTLEMLGIPYVGHDPLSATTLDNKHAFKREAVCAGLPTPPFSTWHMSRGRFLPELNSRFVRAFGEYQGPFVVKPVSGRASLHVHVVHDRKDLSDAVADVYTHTNNVVLIEKFMSGREFCVAVAGPTVARGGAITRGREPFTFGALERLFDGDEKIFTSMDVKPITSNRFKDVDQNLEPGLWTSIHSLAREVFCEFNLGTLIRIDLRADENGQPHILEANPKPDLKLPVNNVTSLVSAGLAQAGLAYDDLILSLLADRVGFLLSHRRGTVAHILELLDSGTSNAELFDAQSGIAQDEADAMVAALDATAQQMRLRHRA
jgi:D-alanine-D-alanine ligase